MARAMNKFEVVMPCWLINDELLELTKNAVESLGDVDLVIVDNGSPIGGGYLRSVAKTYIRNQENLGFAKAMNQGLMLCHVGNYIVLANNDIRVSPNWKECVKDFTNDIYSIHPRMIPYDEPFRYGDRFYPTGKERWCQGSFFIINKDQQIFLYDEEFKYHEDWAYWLKVRSAGLKTAYTEKACFQHKDSSTRNISPTLTEEDKKDRELYREKFGDYPDILFTKQFPEQMKIPWRDGFNL